MEEQRSAEDPKEGAAADALNNALDEMRGHADSDGDYQLAGRRLIQLIGIFLAAGLTIEKITELVFIP